MAGSNFGNLFSGQQGYDESGAAFTSPTSWAGAFKKKSLKIWTVKATGATRVTADIQTVPEGKVWYITRAYSHIEGATMDCDLMIKDVSGTDNIFMIDRNNAANFFTTEFVFPPVRLTAGEILRYDFQSDDTGVAGENWKISIYGWEEDE